MAKGKGKEAVAATAAPEAKAAEVIVRVQQLKCICV